MPSLALSSRLRFLKRTWDDGCVVYVVDSGETHLLSSACALLLERLESGSASLRVLSDEFLSLSDDLTQEELSGLLEDIIRSLRKIGLIETGENQP
ncbi:MAG: HPr-rel-A system PqqD family peptide chaperone [Sulfuritalea sp.]|nr:HPr-rel-A system PqqD family peptide chaperone [Sulfuritalea sp.]